MGKGDQMKEIKKVLHRLIDGKKECITIVAFISPTTKKIAVGFSVCDEQDKFNAEKGVLIAGNRAAKAMIEKKDQFFKRPDVMVDFAMCGLNTHGAKRVPKAIYKEGTLWPDDWKKFRVFMNNKPILKSLGLPS
jgi:hypothetical protein